MNRRYNEVLHHTMHQQRRDVRIPDGWKPMPNLSGWFTSYTGPVERRLSIKITTDKIWKFGRDASTCDFTFHKSRKYISKFYIEYLFIYTMLADVVIGGTHFLAQTKLSDDKTKYEVTLWDRSTFGTYVSTSFVYTSLTNAANTSGQRRACSLWLRENPS